MNTAFQRIKDKLDNLTSRYTTIYRWSDITVEREVVYEMSSDDYYTLLSDIESLEKFFKENKE